MSARYDTIGRSYIGKRRADPRIERQIWSALGDARTVVNVGAGTGSYEPTDRRVVAVEPSAVMIAQRPAGSAPVVRGVAEALPFADGTFDAALAILTVHHWTDHVAGLAELRRVARRQVLLGFDVQFMYRFWGWRDYFASAVAIDDDAPTVDDVLALMGGGRVEAVPVPWDCTDGFGAAYWRRPEAYLEPAVRSSISCFARHDPVLVDEGVERLRCDLESGEWHRRYADLLELDEIDLGYRLLITGE